MNDTDTSVNVILGMPTLALAFKHSLTETSVLLFTYFLRYLSLNQIF